MATGTLAVTNTFASGATITAAGFNTNFTDVVNYINNRNDGTDEWQLLKVTSTTGNCVVISSSAATTEVSIDNTATTGDPMLSWKLSGTAQFSMGVDDSVTGDPLVIAGSGALGTTNIITIASAAPHFTLTSDDATTQLRIDNTAADGDVLLSFALSGTDTYTFGIDDGDSDLWKFGTTALATNVAFQIPTTGAQIRVSDGTVSLPGLSFISEPDCGWYYISANRLGLATNGAKMYDVTTATHNWYNAGNLILALTATTFDPSDAGTISTGTATNYWGDISYKTLTDRGCLPWCDEGVELQDGRIVSDTEALKVIQKHPTKKTIQGLPMLDYRTFPKKSYKKADKEGILIERDENDEPVIGSDGVEMTMMFGVMIGAIRELINRVEILEKK